MASKKQHILDKYGEATNILFILSNTINNIKPKDETSATAIKDIKTKIRNIEQNMVQEYGEIERLVSMV